uniref:Uncharacterized protein n=1 Tax=Zea mays TaxID=4577 RepID=A0A804LKI1_MAIZE
MQNKERLVHVLKGITVGIEKCQATPLSQRCVVQEVLIVWGDHNQLFLVEAFAVHRTLNWSARLELAIRTKVSSEIRRGSAFDTNMRNLVPLPLLAPPSALSERWCPETKRRGKFDRHMGSATPRRAHAPAGGGHTWGSRERDREVAPNGQSVDRAMRLYRRWRSRVAPVGSARTQAEGRAPCRRAGVWGNEVFAGVISAAGAGATMAVDRGWMT